MTTYVNAESSSPIIISLEDQLNSALVSVDSVGEISIYAENPFIPASLEVSSVGIQGAQGYSVLSGNGVPASILGVNQDLYLDLDNTFLYKKLVGVWVYQTYLKAQQKKYIITAQNILDKYITLPITPSNPAEVSLEFVGGSIQENGVEFKVTGSVLSWEEDLINGISGLEGFIAENDIIIVRY